jgi:hypothetical protein
VWQRTRLGVDLLQEGTTLAAAANIVRDHPGAFPPDMDDYVRESEEAADIRAAADNERVRMEARRARRRAWIATGAAVLLAALSLALFKTYRDANHNLVLALLPRAIDLFNE